MLRADVPGIKIKTHAGLKPEAVEEAAKVVCEIDIYGKRKEIKND